MFRAVLIVLFFMFGSGLAQAQNTDVIEKRQKLFKSMLPDVKVGKAMLMGKTDYDQAAAQKVFTTYADVAGKLATMFPADSKTGGDTRALPAIWEKKADFDAKMTTFGKQAQDAAASVTDLASFKAAWGKVMANCGGCHKPYRAKKD